MSQSLQDRISNARPLSRVENASAFITITTVKKKLEMLSEFLDLADAQEQPVRCVGALARIVDSQIFELERLCDKLCPEALEA